jgi:hypothetical protein
VASYGKIREENKYWFVHRAMESAYALSYEFGPFFFAIFFSLVIARTARGWYANARTSGAGVEELATYRAYFRNSYIFGMVLVVASVAWWVVAQTIKHPVFAAVIVALNESESLAPVSEEESFFARDQPRYSNTPTKLRDYRFVKVLDGPPKIGDKITLYYWKIPPSGTGDKPAPTTTIELPITNSTRFPQQFILQHQLNGTVVPVEMR